MTDGGGRQVARCCRWLRIFIINNGADRLQIDDLSIIGILDVHVKRFIRLIQGIAQNGDANNASDLAGWNDQRVGDSHIIFAGDRRTVRRGIRHAYGLAAVGRFVEMNDEIHVSGIRIAFVQRYIIDSHFGRSIGACSDDIFI